MTADIFQQEITRLTNSFGEKAFSGDRVNLIWRYVKYHSGDWFTKTVDTLLSTAKYAPLPGDFHEAAILENNRLGLVFEEVQGTCGACDAGMIYAFELQNGNKYIFKCPCFLGKKRRESWPFWDDCLSSKFNFEEEVSLRWKKVGELNTVSVRELLVRSFPLWGSTK